MTLYFVFGTFFMIGAAIYIIIAIRLNKANIWSCKKCKYKPHEVCENTRVTEMLYANDDGGADLIPDNNTNHRRRFFCALYKPRRSAWAAHRISKLKVKLAKLNYTEEGE